MARLALLLALTIPRVAGAVGPGELTLGAHVDRADAPRGDDTWAFGGWASVGLNDALSVVVSGSVADHDLPRTDASQPGTLSVTSVAGGLRYDLDILSVAPFISVGLGALFQRPEGEARQTDPQVVITVGVDWLLWRPLSIGLAGHWHQLFIDDGEGLFRVGPRLALRWP